MNILDEYLVLDIKATGDNPYLDEIFRVAIVFYHDHIEVSRRVISFLPEKEKSLKKLSEMGIDTEGFMPKAEGIDALANLLKGKNVILYKTFPFLEVLFRNYSLPGNFNYFDCFRFFTEVCPYLSGYNYERFQELLNITKQDDSPYSGCICLQRMFVSFLRMARGRRLDEVTFLADRFISGYWENKAVPDNYAKLPEFNRNEVVVTGQFVSLTRDAIIRIIGDSGGSVRDFPSEKTRIVIAGNTEFPASYQTRAFHEALKKIRENYHIRVISELELLSLLHGQILWEKKVNPYYLPKKKRVVFAPYVFGPPEPPVVNSPKTARRPMIDSQNNRGSLGPKKPGTRDRG